MVAKKVDAKTAEQANVATISGLKELTSKSLTITGDKGSEFAYHEQIRKTLQADFFFAHSYIHLGNAGSTKTPIA